MEGTRAKVEVVKPLLIKAMVPLAVSVAGFIFARLITRSSSVRIQVNPHLTESREELRDEESLSFHSLDSGSQQWEEDEEHVVISTHFTNPLACVSGGDKSDVEEEIFGLRCRIQDLAEREWRLEKQFLNYCIVKEWESMLMELQNSLLLEIAHIEFLGREVSSMEAEHRRFEEFVLEYLRVLKQLESQNSKNRMLERKVRKLSIKAKRLSRVTGKQNAQIEAREAGISRNQTELERKSDVIKTLEGQIAALQTVVDQQQQEKEVLLNELELAENSASSKIKLEDYNHLAEELEQLQIDRATEAKELIFLRWSNACLRHELTRRNQGQEEQKAQHRELEVEGTGEGIGHFGSDSELDCSVLVQGESSPGAPNGSQAHSRKAKLIQKLKKWVEGGEKMKHKLVEKEHPQVKWLRRSLAFEKEEHLPRRKSFSSA